MTFASCERNGTTARYWTRSNYNSQELCRLHSIKETIVGTHLVLLYFYKFHT
ncbi:hypothetical protein IscW_ISCW011641 [Ixodes scapularis]|uniref:Uncharacterized protein n=1 Tax=Ixodes scapularis TaxID=6945 RepID=B7Q6I6_IXOSC|nr:hypothetical protein IscW_ISCW011641 [Ixodes scapularis]|eukprot:XP_002411970.1 hypothetical protein IscW_ISCW011641 [Ixodes scapularis]